MIDGARMSAEQAVIVMLMRRPYQGGDMSQAPAIPTVEIAFTVHTYDIDFANIVSNIVYIRWLEGLRLAMLDRYLPLQTQLA